MAVIYDPEKDKDEKKVAPPKAPQPTGAGIGGVAPTQEFKTAEKRPQGSGRFVNLQKYLEANKQAGQQIAGGIGQRVQRDIGEKQEKAQDYYSKLGESVSQAQQTAQRGGEFTEQLRGIGERIRGATGAEQFGQPQDLGIRQFTQSPEFGQFQDIQAGRGIDERLLAARQQEAARGSQAYLDAARNVLGQLSGEGGRFDLLQQTFGGAARPGYSLGQQRLDQLFLTRGGLQGLREDVGGDVRSAQELAQQATRGAGDVASLTAQEQGLMENIGTEAAASEQAYLDMLQSYVDPLNVQREQEFQRLQDAMDYYTRGEPGKPVSQQYTGFTPEELERLGITEPTRYYDVFKDLTPEDIAIRGREAAGYQDVATDEDLARYQALSQIAGLDPESQRLTSAADIGSAWTGEEGGRSLAERIEQAKRPWELGNIQADPGSNLWRYGETGALAQYADADALMGRLRGGTMSVDDLREVIKRTEENLAPSHHLAGERQRNALAQARQLLAKYEGLGRIGPAKDTLK